MSASFTAEESVELTCAAGVRIWLTPEQPDDGGSNSGGWCHVLSEAGGKGLVPRSYVHFYHGSGQPTVEPPADYPYGEPAVMEVSDADCEPPAGGGEGGGEGGGSAAEAEAVSEWLAYTTVLLAQADDSVALEGIAVADFNAEADVELSIKQGEKVALLHGVPFLAQLGLSRQTRKWAGDEGS